jgi:NAD(P)-dependent dehydrogenase (short-subunit alcohol dehydrogenase family)
MNDPADDNDRTYQGHQKIAVIFGGSGDVGGAIAEKMLNDNYTIYTTFHSRKSSIEHGSNNHHQVECDVSSSSSVNDAISQVIGREKRIDIIINAVSSPLSLKNLEQISPDEFLKDINTILVGGFNILKASIPVLKSNSNSQVFIITFLSESINTTPSRMSSYVAAKSGLSGMIACVANELRNSNIKFVNILPYFIDTKLIKSFPSKYLELEASKLPENRFMAPEEIATVVMKSISDQKEDSTGNIRNILLHSAKDARDI